MNLNFKILRKLSLLPFLLMPLAACDNEEFFTLERPQQDPWQSVDEFELAAVSPYNLAFLSAWGNPYVNDRVMDFVQSDIVHHLGNQEGFAVDALLARATDQIVSQFDEGFRDFYRVIGICNAGLDFYYARDGNPFPGITPENKRNNVDRIAGELHFMRAFAYFFNVRRHAPPYDPNGANADRMLPLRLSFPTGVEDATQPQYATTEEIYQLILEDASMAKSLLPETFVSGMHPSYQFGRVNRFAAATLLAQVYFQMGKWDEARQELDFVINSGRYTLENDPINAFNKDQLGDESQEVIWYIIYSDPFRSSPINEGPKTLTLFNKTHYTAMNGGRGASWSLCPWNQFTLSREALAKMGWMTDPMNGDYSETDAARADKRYQQIFYRMEGYSSDINADETRFLKDSKYNGVDRPIVYSDRYYRAPFGNNFHMPVWRLPELYLMRSVIRFRAGDLGGAAADLNVVAERAHDPAFGTFEPVMAGEISEERIDAEWIKELACEGHRTQYVFALRRPLGPGDRGPEVPNRIIDPPYSRFFWRLPQAELDFKQGD